MNTFKRHRVVMATIGSLGDLHLITHPIVLAGPPLAQKTRIPWFSTVLSQRTVAMVHPGGVGTTGQGLRAGIPMLVVPFAHDRARVERMGVARNLTRNQYKADRVASELKELLGNPAYARNARDIGSRVREENGAALAVDLILDQLNERRANRLALRTVA